MESNTVPNEADDHTRVPFLLHSLAEFGDLIVGAMEIADAKTVVEIGAEEGILTEELLGWAHGRGGRVYAIDPRPSPRLSALAERHPEFELVTEPSLEALTTLPPADCYLCDGDHNHYTVLHELAALAGRVAPAGEFPLVFLHDVGWPCGRRDLYYAPESIPEEARHPFRYDLGAVRESRQLVEGGFRGGGEFAFAVDEGGAANGVLTAVEDFLRDNPHLEFHRVPCVFGLGVLFPGTATYADALRAHLAPYHENPLLERLEDNRLALYLRVLELQDTVIGTEARAAALQSSLDAARRELEEARLYVRDVSLENRALLSRYADLEESLRESETANDRMRSTLEGVVASRSMQIVDALSRHAGRVVHRQVGLARATLERALETPGRPS